MGKRERREKKKGIGRIFLTAIELKNPLHITTGYFCSFCADGCCTVFLRDL